MKKYEYVNVHIGRFCGAKSEEHRNIIDQYAAKGYRYVGYIPTNISDYGKIKDMDLVFEMDEEDTGKQVKSMENVGRRV